MDDCLFCKIVAGEIPATMVYEDDEAVAFLDIRPVNVGHTLVVPRVHARDLTEMDDEAAGRLFSRVRRIATAVSEAVDADGFNIGVNTRPAAGQEVFHVHVHVMPRFEGDGLAHWPKKDVADETSRKAAARIREILAS